MKTKPHFLAAVSVASIHLAVFAVEPNSLTVPLATEKPLYLNTDASVDQRVADLVSRLTLEEIGASSTDIRATSAGKSRPSASAKNVRRSRPQNEDL